MESTNIIQNTINRIDDCVELAAQKQTKLEEKGIDNKKKNEWHIYKVEKVEEGKGELITKAKASATRYCYVLAGIFIGGHIAKYGPSLDKNSLLDILTDVITLSLAYPSSIFFDKYYYYKRRGQEEFGSFTNYLKSLYQVNKFNSDSNKILKDIAKIQKDKEELLNDKSKLEQYLNNGLFMNYSELTSQLIRTNNKVNKLNKKLSSDKVNK